MSGAGAGFQSAAKIGKRLSRPSATDSEFRDMAFLVSSTPGPYMVRDSSSKSEVQQIHEGVTSGICKQIAKLQQDRIDF